MEIKHYFYCMQKLLDRISKHDLIIAIDGYAACGKSTLAKALASAIHYRYIDSGAMYRAVTHYFLVQGVGLDDPNAIDKALEEIEIDIRRMYAQNRTFLNGQDVEEEIRSLKVSRSVSQVAALPAVRKKLVEQQKLMGKDKRLVMDGRDIGTVVFPKADIKLFMLADLDIRTERRCKELKLKGQKTDMEEVRQNLIDRDRIDTTREDSPLTKAADAVILDTSHLDPEQQLTEALYIIAEAIGETL